jgi:hypothetical protein
VGAAARPGDVIEAIDGVAVAELTIEDITELILGEVRAGPRKRSAERASLSTPSSAHRAELNTERGGCPPAVLLLGEAPMPRTARKHTCGPCLHRRPPPSHPSKARNNNNNNNNKDNNASHYY